MGVSGGSGFMIMAIFERTSILCATSLSPFQSVPKNENSKSLQEIQICYEINFHMMPYLMVTLTLIYRLQCAHCALYVKCTYLDSALCIITLGDVRLSMTPSSL